MVSISVCCRGILKLIVVCVCLFGESSPSWHMKKITFGISLTLSSSSYPKYTGILLEALSLWYHNPAVTTPVLKLMAELVLNRSQVIGVCVCVRVISKMGDEFKWLIKEGGGHNLRGITYGILLKNTPILHMNILAI